LRAGSVACSDGFLELVEREWFDHAGFLPRD
jgi:hypothetical protein